MLRLILQENSFQFCRKDYLQTHRTAMGTKMAVAFANIFMSTVETDIINKSKTKPLKWKRYIDDMFSLWDARKEEIDLFILEANRHHTTIKFNQSLLKDEIYVSRLRTEIPNFRKKYSNVEDLTLKWDLIKMEIRGFTIKSEILKFSRIGRQKRNFKFFFICPK